MRFRSPLDDVQWGAALKRHATMRINLGEVRRRFRPRTSQEAMLLKRYRDLVQHFGRELLKPVDRIDPVRLNDLSSEAVEAFVVYLSVRGVR